MEASLLERIGHITFVTSLEFLQIPDCLNMNIPMTGCYNFLVSLMITNGCDSLTTFPLDFFPKLECLFLRGCRNLHVISQGLTHNHLKDLAIHECAQFEALPERMHTLLPYLDERNIDDCPKFESFPNGGLPSNLKKMHLGKCSKLIISLKKALGGNLSLETLGIGLDVKCFPDEGLLPLSLTSLYIYNIQNLKRLDYKGICNLSSLKELFIFDCPSLQCLPEACPNPFQLLLSGATVRCSNSVAKNRKAKTGERLLTFGLFVWMVVSYHRVLLCFFEDLGNH